MLLKKSICYILSHRENHAPGLSVVVSHKVQEGGAGGVGYSQTLRGNLGIMTKKPNNSYH